MVNEQITLFDLTSKQEKDSLDRPTDRPIRKVYCFFEQSGTFKNEFRKLGYEAYDYDILNDYGQTDYQIDLFSEIEKAYDNQPSVFDDILPDDLILAFFPCTKFSSKVPPWLRGEAYSQRNWSDKKKLIYAMNLHKQLDENYILICKLAYIIIDRDLRLVIENPYNHASYLTMFWCFKPRIIDKDRTKNGDRFKKPTQYFFIGCEPKHNLVFEPIDYVQEEYIKRVKVKDNKTRQQIRSEILPQYANRFIRQYLIDEGK